MIPPHTVGGVLEGASTPPLPGVAIPSVPGDIMSVTVPAHLKSGQQLQVQAQGKPFNVTIPGGIGPGDSFQVSLPDPSKVICSTLPMVPGHEIVLSKPIVWASVTTKFDGRQRTTPGEALGIQVGPLLHQAQAQIIQQALQQGCNAVLGLTFNMTHSNPGERLKDIDVANMTAFGTPCCVRILAGQMNGKLA